MKKTSKRTLLFLLLLLFLMPLLLNITPNIEEIDQSNDNSIISPPKKDINIKSSAPDPIIHVTGANWTWTVGNGTATGTGTWGDPYVIQDMVIDANQADYGIRIEYSEIGYFRIENCTVYDAKIAGISLYYADNGTLINNNCSFNDDGAPMDDVGSGIKLGLSENNTIINNILCNNSEYGLYISGWAHNNTAEGNIIINNSRFGVKVGNTNYNKFYNNRIENSYSIGFASWQGVEMTIKGNIISDNGGHGIHFYNADDNTVTENIIRRNDIGVNLGWDTTGTNVYKNNFIENIVHANSDEAGNNFDTSNIGNYWDNYTGNDNTPYDGIGDSSYDFITGGTAVDNYPILELPYFTGEKIHIDETRTNAINWTRAAYLKDYITGSGIISDRYIIQDLIINANDSGNCISIENSDVYFKIENCTLSNSSSIGAAIRFDEVNNSIIIDNKITKNNGDGIWFFFNCWYNTIINNTINESSDHGIYLTATAKYNEIINNKIHNNTGNSKYGIYLNNGAYYNNVSNNHIYNNTGSSRSGIAVRSSSSWNNITNNIIEQNVGNGIYLSTFSIHNRIYHNTILNNTDDGIVILATDVTGCDDNNVTENEIKYNGQNGITLTGGLPNKYLGTNLVENNEISYNTQHGIEVGWFTRYIIIINNNISYNGPSGLYNGISIDNIAISDINITGNLISNHSGVGIAIGGSVGNCLIYNNTFRSNFIHAQDNRTSAPYNQWNSSDTGNYWDNYKDMGVGAVDVDDNGRGDIPYNISGTANSQDHFPLWEDDDDMPPYITVNSPTNDTTWASAPLISVSVSDQNLAYIWYNVTGNPTIEFLINNVGENLNDSLWAGLPQGQFEITFFANDTFGKTSNLTLTYLKDSKPPEIVFNIVLDDSYWNKEPLINITTFDVHPGDIWYNVSGNSTIFFITNNSQSQLDSYIWANFGEGVFQISFFANDSLSNLNNTVIISLTKDTIKPLVSIDRIIEHGHEPPEFELTIFDINIESRWYTLDNGITNKSFFSSTGTIAQDIWDSADVGDLTIIFYARDFAGNIFSQAIGITKEEAPPGEEPPDLMMIIIIVVGIVAGVLTIGIVMVKRSKKEVREIEAEIKTLKEQREEITEDDILISKEKHICLVHKGAVGGMSYICPQCGAYYCVKCYDVVKKAENECWSCNTPLDPSLVSKKKKGIAKKEKKEDKKEKKEDIEIEFGEEPEEIKHKDIEHKAIKPKGLTPLPEHPKEKQELTIRATPVKEDIETKQKELVTEQKIKPQPEESIIPEEKQTLTGAEAVKKFDDYIEQLNVMVQKLDIKFSAGTINQNEYIEKKTMLAEKLGEATAKRDQLKE